MNLKILGSSSSGNCYLLESENETLIIECGVRFDVIKKGLDFNIAKVSGCLVTHEHGDHGKAINEVLGAGINVYATKGTFEGLEIFNHHRAHVIIPDQQFSVGSFKVIPFDIMHDVKQPVGFLINHKETGTILFLTDTYYTKKKFRGLNNILIECNYSKDILDDKLKAGLIPDYRRNRLFMSHMNIETCKEVLMANDLSAVNNIVLIHLSDSNSNAAEFKKEITAATGKRVHVAKAGMEIRNFNKTPF